MKTKKIKNSSIKSKREKASIKIQEVYDFLCQFAPPQLAESWDNIGLQVGNLDDEVNTILVSLDVTEEVLWEAVDHEAQVIITHHPLFFKPIQCLDDSQVSTRLARLASNMDITILSFHTNLDATQNGLNDLLAEQLKLKNCTPLLASQNSQKSKTGLGRVGQLSKKVTLQNLLENISSQLKIKNIRFAGSLFHEVKKVAVMTGSGAGFFNEALTAGADVLVTGDLKYHQALDAISQSISIIDIGHFAGEIGMVSLVTEKLKAWAKKQNHALQIFGTQVQSDPIQYWNSQASLPENFLEKFKVA
ncbi:MAG: Nif3-like dinuclear metal center hexameric protein [Deltaproteobacteria bacterium]|nr:Nif3-like dinuclear metal center hexameric protein [Deltaproteobacteria bacterium]